MRRSWRNCAPTKTAFDRVSQLPAGLSEIWNCSYLYPTCEVVSKSIDGCDYICRSAHGSSTKPAWRFSRSGAARARPTRGAEASRVEILTISTGVCECSVRTIDGLARKFGIKEETRT